MVVSPPPRSARIEGAAMLVIRESRRSMTSAARITNSATQRHLYGVSVKVMSALRGGRCLFYEHCSRGRTMYCQYDVRVSNTVRAKYYVRERVKNTIHRVPD